MERWRRYRDAGRGEGYAAGLTPELGSDLLIERDRFRRGFGLHFAMQQQAEATVDLRRSGEVALREEGLQQSALCRFAQRIGPHCLAQVKDGFGSVSTFQGIGGQ